MYIHRLTFRALLIMEKDLDKLTRLYGKMQEYRLRKYYCEKTYIQAEVLRIIFYNEVNGNQSIARTDLFHYLCNMMTKSIYWKTPAELVDRFISELEWKGFIDVVDNKSEIRISLTEEGRKTYKAGTLENTAASLFFAKSTNKLSVMAISISVISILITLLI